MKFLSFEILYIFFNFQIFKFLKLLNFNFFCGKFWPPTDGISPPYPSNIDPPYPWYIDPPTHGILTPLSMVYWPPYPWYIDPLTHGISTPLPMVFWPPYPWYIDPPTHGILNPLPMVYPMVYWTPYPRYIDPPIHGILPPLPIEYRPPTHDILTSLHIFWLEMGGFKIPWGFNLPYRGGSVFNKGVQYTMDVNRPQVQFTMGFKITYDTGTRSEDLDPCLVVIWIKFDVVGVCVCQNIPI